MGSEFNPPPTLSKDDVRRVADVRRDVGAGAGRPTRARSDALTQVWTAGIKGAVAGVFVGSTGWLAARSTGTLPKAFRTPNHFSLARRPRRHSLVFLPHVSRRVRRVADAAMFGPRQRVAATNDRGTDRGRGEDRVNGSRRSLSDDGEETCRDGAEATIEDTCRGGAEATPGRGAAKATTRSRRGSGSR